MKKLLQHAFYWDCPAQGAFFGLTLAGVGSYLLFSLFHFLWMFEAFGRVFWPMFWDKVVPPPLAGFNNP